MYPSYESILRDYKQDLESWKKELYVLSAKPFGLNKTTSMVIDEINRLKNSIERLEQKIADKNVIEVGFSGYGYSKERTIEMLDALDEIANGRRWYK